jgi:hypothetical protein
MIDIIMSPSAIQRGAINAIRAEVSVGAWDAGNMMRQVQLTIPEDIRLMSDIPVVQLELVGANAPAPIVVTTNASPSVVVGTAVTSPILTVTPQPVLTGTVIATVTKIDN